METRDRHEDLIKKQNKLNRAAISLGFFKIDSIDSIEGLTLDQHDKVLQAYYEIYNKLNLLEDYLKSDPNHSGNLVSLSDLDTLADEMIQAFYEFNSSEKTKSDSSKLEQRALDLFKQAEQVTTAVPAPQPLPEAKTDNRGFWAGTGMVSSVLLTTAGVLATFLGGPVGAIIGIPLFIAGVIDGLATAGYLGWTFGAGDPSDGAQKPTSEDVKKDAWNHAGQQQPSKESLEALLIKFDDILDKTSKIVQNELPDGPKKNQAKVYLVSHSAQSDMAKMYINLKTAVKI